MHRPARFAPGGKRQGHRIRDPHRAGAELFDPAVEHLRAEELLLSRPAEELPDLAVRRPDRLRGIPRRRALRRNDVACRDRARPHGGGHGQVTARGWRRPHSRRRSLTPRLQPRRRAARRDRDQADHRCRGTCPRGRPCLRHGVARPTQVTRRLGRPHGSGVAALRCQCVVDAQGCRGVRHPHRDQERQLAQECRGRRHLRNAKAGSGSRVRRRGRAGNAPLPRIRRHHVGGASERDR